MASTTPASSGSATAATAATAAATAYANDDAAPQVAMEAVLVKSESLDEADHPAVGGVDWNKHVDLDALMAAMATTGFQATELGRAVDEINRMRNWRLSDEPVKADEDPEFSTPEARSQVKCKIFLSFTSNMISSGVRETIRYLVQHKMVDVLVTTAGGIEEDIMKCITPHYLGDFSKWKGPELRKRGLNRIGNLLVPNQVGAPARARACFGVSVLVVLRREAD